MSLCTLAWSLCHAARRGISRSTNRKYRWLSSPATTSIINPYKSTADRHEILAYQMLIHVSTFERGPGDYVRLRIAMAYRAASDSFSDRLFNTYRRKPQCLKIRKCETKSVPA